MSIHTTTQESLTEAELEEDEEDLLAAGRAYADAKEYMRASNLLQNSRSAKGRFMYRYFDFIVREGCCL